MRRYSNWKLESVLSGSLQSLFRCWLLLRKCNSNNNYSCKTPTPITLQLFEICSCCCSCFCRRCRCRCPDSRRCYSFSFLAHALLLPISSGRRSLLQFLLLLLLFLFYTVMSECLLQLLLLLLLLRPVTLLIGIALCLPLFVAPCVLQGRLSRVFYAFRLQLWAVL